MCCIPLPQQKGYEECSEALVEFPTVQPDAAALRAVVNSTRHPLHAYQAYVNPWPCVVKVYPVRGRAQAMDGRDKAQRAWKKEKAWTIACPFPLPQRAEAQPPSRFGFNKASRRWFTLLKRIAATVDVLALVALLPGFGLAAFDDLVALTMGTEHNEGQDGAMVGNESPPRHGEP
jgi:hypothetical protein